MGQAGVTKALEIIHKELDITMAFCGHTDIGTVDRSILLPGNHPDLIRAPGLSLMQLTRIVPRSARR